MNSTLPASDDSVSKARYAADDAELDPDVTTARRTLMPTVDGDAHDRAWPTKRLSDEQRTLIVAGSLFLRGWHDAIIVQ